MADDINEDSWLYGNASSNPEPPEDETESSEQDPKKIAEENEEDKEDIANEAITTNEQQNEVEREEEEEPQENAADEMEEMDDPPNGVDEHDDAVNNTDGEPDDSMQDRDQDAQNGGDSETDDSDDDDDDINVVIGEIQSGPSYNIKQRGTLLPASAIAGGPEKIKQPQGKFSIEEFESVGTINGVQAHEFSIDSLDEKPWRKPGADITDYFNYGFNEDTWRAYCERQKKMRLNESGVGLSGLTVAQTSQAPQQNQSANQPNNRTLTTLANDNSKYTSATNPGLRRAGPPPGRKMNGSIDVIGGHSISSRREIDTITTAPPKPPGIKENVIQVMTADRREYSRTVVGNKFDVSVPPPPFQGGGGPQDSFYDHEYNYGYEPTQDSQWGPENTNWTPSIKELTPGMGPPQMVPPPNPIPQLLNNMGPPMADHHMGMGMPPALIGLMPNSHNNPSGPRGMMGQGPQSHQQHSQQQQQLQSQSASSSNRDNHDRDKDRERDREREREFKQEPRESDRVHRDREVSRDREKDRERRNVNKADRYRDRRKERSRSRERETRDTRSRRRSRSRSRERRSRDRKKSHRKEKGEESD